MDPVVHFELPAENRDRMAEFYMQVFDWKANFLKEDMGNYVLVTTVNVDENGIPKYPGMINGGLYPKTKDTSPYPSIVIAVKNIKESMKQVEKAGGKVHGEPTLIANIGQYVSFTDTEGNRLSMLQVEGM